MKKEYYEKKIIELQQLESETAKKIRNISIYRLVIVILGVFIIYQAFSYSSVFGFLSLFVIIILFIWIVKWHNKLFSSNEKTQNLLKIYKNEIDLSKHSNLFGNGEQYKKSNHAYTADLDIFGSYSLFNILNRTATSQGESILAKLFSNTGLTREKIIIRQNIIKELSEKVELKENLLLTFFLSDKKENVERIKNWVSVFKYYFIDKSLLRIVLFALSTLTIVLLIAGFALPLLWKYAILLLVINYFINMKYFKQVSLIHDHISKQEGMFSKFSMIIKHIKSEKFENEYLQQLKNKLLGHDNLEKQLSILSKLIKKLDYRLNVIVAIVLNMLFYWDIQHSYKVEKWMKDNSPNIPYWLETIGEFDAYLSMSILYYNNPDWVFPIIIDDEIIIEAKEIGHPLIDKENRISNDYTIEGKGKFDIVTGSNMAGKSTFLRTIGINTILALNGCPVCAKSFTVSNIKLITYMRIIDSLEDNLSTFHAELERIKSILRYVEDNDNCFLLLDELLRGTNSQDRHVGTVALIKQMMRNNASGVIATHDLGLTEMIEEYPENIRNYNFGVKTKGEELYFDYKLTYGVCDSFNASILMKKIGIDIDLVSKS